MRLDTRLDRTGLTDKQIFFIECWSSLCCLKSIDSDRVTYNNVLNATEEILELYTHENRYNAVEKRRHVIRELRELFSIDPCINHVDFDGIPQHIIGLCDENRLTDQNISPVEKNKTLMISLLSQLSGLIRVKYRRVVINSLQEILFSANPAENDDFDKIYYLTNSLVSVLITLGMPTSECFLLVKNFFFNREFEFSRVFELFSEKIGRDPFPIRIIKKLKSERLYNLIRDAGGEIKFKNCSFILSTAPREEGNASIVSIDVDAISFNAAKKKSMLDLHKALDVIAYMMGGDDVEVVKKYTAINKSNTIETKTLIEFDKPIINALDRLSRDGFELYMSTMSSLYEQAAENTIRKISAAFRFFKNGLSDDTSESRFTAFWSALESLTLGVSEQSLSHDEHVIQAVLPCVALDYPLKQLFALRAIAKELNWLPIDGINLSNANIGSLYLALKNEEFSNEVLNRLSNYPYAKYRFSAFILLCKSPYKLAVKMQSHKNKVELQLHRLYRTRNAIVHNASTPDRLDMLVVNLEHYLRSTLNAMIYMMNSATSISSPEEAFNRYNYQADCILNEMDPSINAKDRQKEGIRTGIANNTVRVSDQYLVKWLGMHI